MKTVTPEDKHYEFSAFNECKTNALDWMVYIAAFSACIASRDYALASGIVLVLYAELEIFRITGTVS